MSKSCLSCKIRHFRMKICYGRKKKSGQDEKEEYSRMKRVRSYEENRTKNSTIICLLGMSMLLSLGVCVLMVPIEGKASSRDVRVSMVESETEQQKRESSQDVQIRRYWRTKRIRKRRKQEITERSGKKMQELFSSGIWQFLECFR